MLSTIEVAIASIALCVGLVHGTYDWLLLSKQWKDSSELLGLFEITLLYQLLFWPYLVLWILYPELGVLSFLILTALHWGQEELYFAMRILEHNELKDIKHKASLVLSRGGMTVVFPLLYYHEDYELVVNTILSLFGREDSLWWLFARPTRGVLVSVVLAILVYYLLRSLFQKDAIVSLGLAIWFLFMPVAISIPIYLAYRHTSIHMTRVYRLGVDNTRSAAILALPYTVGAALIYILGLLAFPNATDSLLNAAGLYLVLLSLLTLPHTVVNTVLDVEQGLY